MAWTIRFSDQATRQLERLDGSISKRIFRFLNDRLAAHDDPRTLGAPMQGAEWHGFLRYRVGDYRLICEIEDELVVIVVIEIGHRSMIYR